MIGAGSHYGLLEPPAWIAHFLAHPPRGFDVALTAQDVPAFVAPFDLLTTADPALRRRVARLPGYSRWSRLLRWRTCFVGTTVSEYGLFPRSVAPTDLADMLRRQAGNQALTIVKDLPLDSPLLDEAANRHADALAQALQRAGFVLLEGQALAWVSIDFASSDEYIARLSSGRRKNLRRKLRSRAALDIRCKSTGPEFADAALRAECYALYEAVYAQSEMHFDHLTPGFFDAILQDAGLHGRMFLYHHGGRMIGWNLCLETGDALIDKYVGFRYPEARTHNLYAVSWMVNLDHAVARGLKRYVAGWTDPQAKASLGASFTFTRHAVRPRGRLLRWLLGRVAGLFESDRAAIEGGR